MNKNLLTYLSHNFCVNCCGDAKKLNCDSKNVTCDKLASFLVGCNLYKEPIDEEKLDKLAELYCPLYPKYIDAESLDIQEAYKDGYLKGYEDKQ